jgi:hypothetical protein
MVPGEKHPISIVELASGERIGLASVEIISMPHLSTLQKRFAKGGHNGVAE